MSDNEGFVHRDILMKITGNHPHTGEYGHPCGNSPNTITKSNHCGPETYLIELIDCPHGTDRCYAEKKNLALMVEKSQDKTPRPRRRR